MYFEKHIRYVERSCCATQTVTNNIQIYLYIQASPSEGYDADNNYSGVNNENLDQEGY